MKCGMLFFLCLIIPLIVIIGIQSTKADCIGTTYNFTCGNVNESCALNQSESISSDCYNLTSSDLTFDCNGNTITQSANSSAIYNNNSALNNLTVQNCIFTNQIDNHANVLYGIYFTNVGNVTIKNNTFHNETYGVRTQILRGFLNISNNTFNAERTAFFIYGDGAYATDWISINNNTATELNFTNDLVATHNNAISLRTLTNVTVIENDLRTVQTSDYMRGLWEILNVYNSTIENNTFVGPYQNINMWLKYSDNITIKENNFLNGTDGLALEETNNLWIEDNYFNSNFHHPIITFQYTGDRYNNTIIGNRMHNAGYNGIATYSDQGYSQKNFTIKNNEIINGSWDGIWLGYGSTSGNETVDIENNTISNFGTCVYLNVIGDITMKGNTLSNCTYGLSMPRTLEYMDIQNNIYINNTDGIYVIGPEANFTNETMLNNTYAGLYTSSGGYIIRCTNCNFSNPGAFDVYDSRADTYLINSTVNLSALQVDTGWAYGAIYGQYYFNAFAENNTGDALENINITGYDNTGTAEISLLTNSSGQVNGLIPAYKVDYTNTYYYLSNYSVNATHNNYIHQAQIVNITEDINLTFNMTLDNVNPLIEFLVPPTPNSNDTLIQNWFTVQINITEDNIQNQTINIYNSTGDLINSTNETMINLTHMNNGLYYFNATVFDWNNNSNQTDTWNVTLSSLGCQGDTMNFVIGDTITESCNLTGDLVVDSYNTAYTVATNDLIIDGKGFNITGDGTTKAFSITSQNVTIKNIILDMHSDGIDIYNTQLDVIDNVTITNSQVEGIYTEYCDYVTINNSRIDGSIYYGVYFLAYLASGGNIVTNSNISNNGLATNGFGVYDNTGIGTNITNNNFTGNYDDIYLANTNAGEVSYNQISGATDAGIYSSGTVSCFILNNNISDKTYGLYDTDAYQQTLYGNNISNNFYNWWIGISNPDYLSYTIDDTNTFDGKYVRVYTSQSDIGANTTDAVMIIASYNTNLNISGGNLGRNMSHGIIIGGDTNARIQNNSLSAYYGVQGISETDMVVDNNTISLCEYSITHSGTVNITNNNFSDNTYGVSDWGGIYVINNTFELNDYAVELREGENSNYIENNIFNNNTNAIYLYDRANTNNFTNSTFYGNTYDVNIDGHRSCFGPGCKFWTYYYPNNNNFIDTNISGTIVDNSWTTYNNLINSTFDSTLYSTTHTGILYVYWWLDVYINDSLGNPVENAEVYLYDVYETDWTGAMYTNSSGYLTKFLAIDYDYSNSGRYDYNNLTLNATNSSRNESVIFNHTTNELKYIMFDEPPNISTVYLSSAYYNEEISCLGTYQDIDKNTESNSTYRWFVNNISVNYSTKTIAPNIFNNGESVKCEYTPCDNFSCGIAVNSSAVIVTHNSNPTYGGGTSGSTVPYTLVIKSPSIIYKNQEFNITVFGKDGDKVINLTTLNYTYDKNIFDSAILIKNNVTYILTLKTKPDLSGYYDKATNITINSQYLSYYTTTDNRLLIVDVNPTTNQAETIWDKISMLFDELSKIPTYVYILFSLSIITIILVLRRRK